VTPWPARVCCRGAGHLWQVRLAGGCAGAAGVFRVGGCGDVAGGGEDAAGRLLRVGGAVG
jgi:hypothetical protein